MCSAQSGCRSIACRQSADTAALALKKQTLAQHAESLSVIPVHIIAKLSEVDSQALFPCSFDQFDRGRRKANSNATIPSTSPSQPRITPANATTPTQHLNK